MKPFTTFCLLIVSAFLTACSGHTPANNTTAVQQNVGIDGEDILIYKGPGTNFDKIVNDKATEAFRQIMYCEVDYTTKVDVLETKADWSKIRVVEPEWLSDSHIGWIPSRYLVSKEKEAKKVIVQLKASDYRILTTRHNAAVQNFHVLVKRKKFDEEYIYQFCKAFRSTNCTGSCNLYIYDSSIIKNLIGIHPLPDADYLKMADHLVAISSSGSELRDWYPYQDFRYKKLGGKNFK